MGLLENYICPHIFAILNTTEYLHVKNAFQYQLSSDHGDNVRWLAYENDNVVIKIRMLNLACQNYNVVYISFVGVGPNVERSLMQYYMYNV